VRRSRRSRSVGAVLVLGALVLAACGPAATPDETVTDEGTEAAADGTQEGAGDEEGPADEGDGTTDGTEEGSGAEVVDDGRGTDDEPTEEEPEAATEPLEPLQGVALEVVVDDLVEPLDVVALPGGDALLVVERRGVVRLIEGGQPAADPYLDLRDVTNADSIEQGVLGIALHPAFPEDPRVLLFHSLANNNNVLVSYALADSGDRLDPATRTELLTVVKQPDMVRHNGGHLEFGPDGLLYVAVGDAARASVNGQDPATLPGTILRLDVDGGEPYAVPDGNPFADGAEGAPEVWWYGLRNPWRFSIDADTGLAYIADVGQGDVEEVNVVPVDQGGLNFGWPVFEGTDVFYGGEPDSPVTDPVLVARHDDTDLACSITGGRVYRGQAIPELDGHYLYADWCRGWIRSFRYDDGEALDEEDWTEQLGAQMVSSFGVDGDGELLVVDYAAGSVSRLVAVR
jgi:glucose/arabinose dehydrogenase